MIMAIIALLVVAPSLLLAFTCTEYELYSCIQLSKNQSLPMCPLYLPISIFAIPSIFIMLLSIFQIKFFCYEKIS
jgi:hypothetical protein